MPPAEARLLLDRGAHRDHPERVADHLDHGRLAAAPEAEQPDRERRANIRVGDHAGEGGSIAAKAEEIGLRQPVVGHRDRDQILAEDQVGPCR
jgi:hypothetical protein